MPANQFRPPLPETNPNVRKNDTTEKRKRATPKKKFRPATPKINAMCPPLTEVPPKPKNNASSVPIREDTPWPSLGKMLGNLFKDRNWLLPKNYLVTKNKNEDTSVTSTRPPLKEEPKVEEQATSQMQKNVVGAKIFLSVNPKRRKKKISNSRSHHQMYQGLKLKDPMP